MITYIIVTPQWNVFKAFLLNRLHQTPIDSPKLIEFIYIVDIFIMNNIQSINAKVIAQSHRSADQEKVACDPFFAFAR